MNKEVEVIKAFQPTISESNKIVSNPKINDTVKYTPIFDYRIQSSLVPVPRSIQKLPVFNLEIRRRATVILGIYGLVLEMPYTHLPNLH
jgi:hypothetical protein